MPSVVQYIKDAKRVPKKAIQIATSDTHNIFVDPDIDGGNELLSQSPLRPFPFIDTKNKQRQGIYISGQSGSGKSVFARNLIMTFKDQMNKKELNKDTGEMIEIQTPVRIFSRTTETDPAFAGIKMMNKINVNDPNIFQITPELLKNSIVVFDDYDQVQNKNLLVFLKGLIKGILEVGRKLNIQVIIINHQTMDYNKTRDIIFECNAYVLFPGSNRNATFRFIDNYIKPDKSMLRKLNDIKLSQFSFFYFDKRYPAHFISDNRVILM